MKKVFSVLALLLLGQGAFAQSDSQFTVQDVTHEYQNELFTSVPGAPNADPTPAPIKINFDKIISIGTQIWDFLVKNKPVMDYAPVKGAVVPGGISDFRQLSGWSRPVSKVYRVQFKNVMGGVGGYFDYGITFLYGGSYQGKGKYIGQISFAVRDSKLKTDRSLNLKAELLQPFNFGTEADPIAGVQLQVTWSSPTTTRYVMGSAEYFFYGTGEIQNLTTGAIERFE